MNTSALCLSIVNCLYYSWSGELRGRRGVGYTFLYFPFLVYVPVEAFHVLCIPFQDQFQLGLCLPDPIPTLPSSMSVLLSRYLSLLPKAVLFPLKFEQQVLVRHAVLLPSFPVFLHLGMKSSCTLRKVSLKICQVYSISLSLSALSPRGLLTSSMKS